MDTVLALMSLVLLLLVVGDWLQTLTIAANPRAWRERNVVLRTLMECYPPSQRVRPVTFYFGVALFLMVVAPVLAGKLWSPLEPLLLGAFTLVEAICVWNNQRLGIEFANPFEPTDY